MAKSLLEYADWLDGRDLVWPRPPRHKVVEYAPRIKPLRGVRAVVWNIYGTLLRISDGRLLFRHPQQIRMQVALEKTVREFNMWNSMYRKPGAPWEYLLSRYENALQKQETVSAAPGNFPAVNASLVWKMIIRELQRKEYHYDVRMYGDIDQFSEKVAYFFHSSLQGLERAPGARKVTAAIARAGIRQGLFGDAQPFTPVQMLRAFRAKSTLPPPAELFAADCSVLSWQEGYRMPSRSLFEVCLSRFERLGIEPREVLHVSSRLKEDLVPSRRLGMRTALYAGDEVSLDSSPADWSDPEQKPDAVLTDFVQFRELLVSG